MPKSLNSEQISVLSKKVPDLLALTSYQGVGLHQNHGCHYWIS